MSSPSNNSSALNRSTVIGVYFKELAYKPIIHVTEILLKSVVQLAVGITVFKFGPLVHNGTNAIGRQQPFVFRKEDEEKTV